MKCDLCPNLCGVDRKISLGRCGAGDTVKIAKYYLHKYEEPCISGSKGSGTVFFCGCSLKCAFCQNYELSRVKRGKDISVYELADIFRTLEEQGAENINLVTPTHYADKIMRALDIYRPLIPVVYNTHGYENLSSLYAVDKYVDVYLPDLKFFSPEVSERYTGIRNYFDVAAKAIEFMAKKPLIWGENGMMKSGTLVRHLLLPLNLSDSKKIIDFLAELKDKVYISLMSQYTPFGEIKNFPELNRKVTKREYESLIDYALSKGITNMFYQKLSSAEETYIPRWDF